VIYRFGDIELDTTLFELRAGGVVTAVEPQVFDVLRYLVVNRDRLVTKEELLDNVWGDRFVSESALTTRIKTARRAVGDDGQSQHIERTVHGRGYRFVAPVEEIEDSAAAATPDAPAAATREPATELGANLFIAGGELPSAVTTWPLLGRASEIEITAAAFNDPDAGGILFTGGAGVGKTRLADECLRLAAEAGFPVARVTGHPETKRVPLAAFSHLLPADVMHVAGPEGELERGALFHRARTALEQIGDGRRWVVMADDVNHLDELSRALLVSLVHARTAFVVCTLRSGGDAPPDPAVQLLVKDGHLRTVEPVLLDDDTVAALLHRVLGAPIDDESLGQLAAAATGNPGVLRQLVESALDTGRLVEDDGMWHLTERLVYAAPTLELLVAERLAGLGPEEREVVELLSVAGELGLGVLEDMVGGEVLETLEHRGLLSVTKSGRRTNVALVHPLFAEVIHEQIPEVRGRRIRRSLADAITKVGARRTGDRVRVVAWRLEGGGHVESDLLAEAARLALVEGDDAMAERILGQARELDRTPEVVQLQAEMKFRNGDTAGVEGLLSNIDNCELDDPVRAQVVRRRANNMFFGTGRIAEPIWLLMRALDEVTEPEPRLNIEAYHVLLLAMAGSVSEAIARSDGAPPASMLGPRLEMLRGRALALAVAGRGEHALPLVEEGREVHASLPPDLAKPGKSLLMFTKVVALGELGELEEASAAARHYRTERPEGTRTSWMALAEARINLITGRPGEIRSQLASLVRTSRSLGHGSSERWALALVACARLQQGDRFGAEADLIRVASLEDEDRGVFHTDIDRAHAWLAAERDGLPAARERLEAAADDAARLGKFAFEAGLRHDIVRFGGASTVVERMRTLAECVQGRLVQARLAHALGAANHDPMQLDAAIEGFVESGALVLAAEAAADLADCLAAQGDQRGAVAARARVASLRGAMREWVVTPALARSEGVEPLSEREREVALLAAHGLSSRDIGARLFVSTRTVDNHLQHVYVKLGVKGRDGLATALGISAPEPEGPLR
jgi:DNA-binding winged helix-turn-helix (wHTH) protein/DNA-binding CsgD family transcriptional regulator